MQRPAAAGRKLCWVWGLPPVRGGQHPGQMIKVPVHNTRRAAIDTGVVAWNAALRRVGAGGGFRPRHPAGGSRIEPSVPRKSDIAGPFAGYCRTFPAIMARGLKRLLEYGPTEILAPVRAISKHPARL